MRCAWQRLLPTFTLLAALSNLAPASEAASAAELQATAERLALKHRVCALAYVTLTAGVPGPTLVASGCPNTLPPAADAIFQAASLSKPVFAYAVLQLVQQGVLDLDTPLLNYLPGGAYVRQVGPQDRMGPPANQRVEAPELAGVTARMLLSHTSGLPNWAPTRLVFGFAPGTAWRYSGEGYMLLQHAVETLSGQKLGDFMRSRVFEPLGMSSSSYRWTPQLARRLVAGLGPAGQKREHQFYEAFAAASLYTTAADYARFVAALLGDAGSLQLSLNQPAAAEATLGLDWALGWGLEGPAAAESTDSTNSGAPAVPAIDNGPYLWQWGANQGYRSFVMASASSGNAFILLTNSDNGLALAEPLTQMALPGQHAAFRFFMLR